MTSVFLTYLVEEVMWQQRVSFFERAFFYLYLFTYCKIIILILFINFSNRSFL